MLSTTPLLTPSRISRDILDLVRSSVRVIPIALFTASLFAVDRLHPIEIARFRSLTEGIVFDAEGYAYVSHGRMISRVSTNGAKSVWAETGAMKRYPRRATVWT